MTKWDVTFLIITSTATNNENNRTNDTEDETDNGEAVKVTIIIPYYE